MCHRLPSQYNWCKLSTKSFYCRVGWLFLAYHYGCITDFSARPQRLAEPIGMCPCSSKDNGLPDLFLILKEPWPISWKHKPVSRQIAKYCKKEVSTKLYQMHRQLPNRLLHSEYQFSLQKTCWQETGLLYFGSGCICGIIKVMDRAGGFSCCRTFSIFFSLHIF